MNLFDWGECLGNTVGEKEGSNDNGKGLIRNNAFAATQ